MRTAWQPSPPTRREARPDDTVVLAQASMAGAAELLADPAS